MIYKGRRNALLSGVAGLRERNRALNGENGGTSRGAGQKQMKKYTTVCVCGHGCDFCLEQRSRFRGGRWEL